MSPTMSTISQTTPSSDTVAVLHTVSTIEDFRTLQAGWEQLTSEPLHSYSWHFAWWTNFHLSLIHISEPTRPY